MHCFGISNAKVPTLISFCDFSRNLKKRRSTETQTTPVYSILKWLKKKKKTESNQMFSKCLHILYNEEEVKMYKDVHLKTVSAA